MSVLILQGSPRRSGNTEIVCEAMSQAFQAAGRQVETVRVADLKIGGCTECFACQKVTDAPGCTRQDDMTGLYTRILKAKQVVLATPVFCWDMTSQLRAVVDRFFAFCKFQAQQDDGQFISLVQGKPIALVVTAGGGPYDGAEICVTSFRRMQEFMRMKSLGEFVGAPLGQPKETQVDAALLKRAAEFATKMVQ